jgi:hypothetical protein
MRQFHPPHIFTIFQTSILMFPYISLLVSDRSLCRKVFCQTVCIYMKCSTFKLHAQSVLPSPIHYPKELDCEGVYNCVTASPLHSVAWCRGTL